jgi:hypothetical protein
VRQSRALRQQGPGRRRYEAQNLQGRVIDSVHQSPTGVDPLMPVGDRQTDARPFVVRSWLLAAGLTECSSEARAARRRASPAGFLASDNVRFPEPENSRSTASALSPCSTPSVATSDGCTARRPAFQVSAHQSGSLIMIESSGRYAAAL